MELATPAEYDKPYEGILMFQRLPLEQIQKICAPGQIGCAMPISTFNGGKQWQININGNRVACVIFLVPDSYLKEHHQDPKDAIRHETAHCNGWPGDHPNSQSKMGVGREMKPAGLKAAIIAGMRDALGA